MLVRVRYLEEPETLAIISKIAGIDLVTEMDFEIGHVNISVKSEKQRAEELAAFTEDFQRGRRGRRRLSMGRQANS
jgi:hypothetical protein